MTTLSERPESQSVKQAQPAVRNRREVRRVVLSSYLGSTIEFYDFLLYATAAAIVFAPVFFSNLSPVAGTIASMGTFAVGYLARPLGGVIFGHFGDRHGRKSMLLISMTIMGVASFLIGLVPPASMIGSWGAICLVVLRLCQGIAVGGEWGGAALMSLEHVGGKGRGFAASFTNAGAPTGSLLGTVALAIVALLPEDDFLSWGWRIPFLLSAVMLVVGLYVRVKVSESPMFAEAAKKEAAKNESSKAKSKAKKPLPLLSILKRPRNLLLVAFGCMASFGIQTMFTTFAIGYAANSGITRTQSLVAFAICQFFAIFTLLAFARLSDRVGRRPVMLFGLTAFAVLIYPILGAVVLRQLRRWWLWRSCSASRCASRRPTARWRPTSPSSSAPPPATPARRSVTRPPRCSAPGSPPSSSPRCGPLVAAAHCSWAPS